MTRADLTTVVGLEEDAGAREDQREPRPDVSSGQPRVLILAGGLGRLEAACPIAGWLDRLESRGCRVQLLCFARGTAMADDPRCVEVPALGNRWLRAWAVRTLWSRDDLERPELIHAVHDGVGELALDVAESAGLPYIQTLGDFRTLTRGFRVSQRWCRRIVAIRAELAEALVDALGVPAARVCVIPPGITRADEPERHLAADRVPVIGAGGALDDMSGVLVFLEAARRILDDGRDAEFIIACREDSHGELRQHAQALQIIDRVTVAEFPSVGADFWSVLDVYCQPSIVPNSGLTLLQAMAHAVPCVATSAAGLRGLIEPGRTGQIVSPGDPRALQAAITGLLDRPAEARRLGQAGRLRVRERFDPDAETNALVALYGEVLGRSLDPVPIAARPPAGS